MFICQDRNVKLTLFKSFCPFFNALTDMSIREGRGGKLYWIYLFKTEIYTDRNKYFRHLFSLITRFAAASNFSSSIACVAVRVTTSKLLSNLEDSIFILRDGSTWKMQPITWSNWHKFIRNSKWNSCRTVALWKNFCWQTGKLQCHP